MEGIEVKVLCGLPTQNDPHFVLSKIGREGNGHLPEIFKLIQNVILKTVDISIIRNLPIKLSDVLYVDDPLVGVAEEFFFCDFNLCCDSLFRHHNVGDAGNIKYLFELFKINISVVIIIPDSSLT